MPFIPPPKALLQSKRNEKYLFQFRISSPNPQKSLSSLTTTEGLDFFCRGSEETPMLNQGRREAYPQPAHTGTSTSSLLYLPPMSSPKTPTTSRSSTINTISLPQPPIPCLKPTALSAPFSQPITPSRTSPSLPTLFIQSSSTTTPSSTSSTPCSRNTGYNRVIGISSQRHRISIQLGALRYSLPANYLMWHPVGHTMLLRAVIHSRVIHWGEYFGLWKHIFQASAGGIRCLHLEDLKNERWIVSSSSPPGKATEELVEAIGYTWEGRAFLEWEKNVFISFVIIIYSIMKGLLICFVHWGSYV